MVTVGIIAVIMALAIPAVLYSVKRSKEIRIRSDLALIGTALEAYKVDFGDYPRFADALSDQASAAASTKGNGTWLDYAQGNIGSCRGATLLCRALLGPGPAVTSSDSADGYPASPGDDGADGPGFRVRRIQSGTNKDGTPIWGGKVYGPYLDSSKFKILYADGIKNQAILSGYPAAYPLLIDVNGNPILYYPAAPGIPPVLLGYTDPSTATTNTVSRFNGFDNEGFLDASGGGSSFVSTSPFAMLAASAGTANYLLWSAGNDNQFGLLNGKSDDVTNFDLPANLKK
jgi:type II secretory pathway pseudopilin PulG